MKFYSEISALKTRRRLEVIDVTGEVRRIVSESGVENGLVNLWVKHTAAAIAVNERDVDLWEDILAAMRRLVPLEGEYRHNIKYGGFSKERNAHAHILNCMIKPGVTIPLKGEELLLGTWQSILFMEFDGPRSRFIHVQVTGE